MNAEQLIDLYLERSVSSGLDSKFRKQLTKGQNFKKSNVKDLPYRDTNFNVDQDITWRSSSTPPY